jgi:hypothetical protein
MELNLELRKQSRACDKLPWVFQTQLDQLKRITLIEIEHAANLAAAKERARWLKGSVAHESGWLDRLWQALEVPIIIVGATAIVGLSFVAGWQLRGVLQ